MAGIAAFIALLFVCNFLFVISIYPLIVQKKIHTDAKKIFNRKFRVSKYRYFSTAFSCSCIILILIYEIFHMLKYQDNVSFNSIGMMVIIVLLLIIICLYKLLFIYPRKHILFQNNKMYYHNGFKEICIATINSVKTFEIGWRVSYWYVLLNINDKKRIFLDVLLFSEAESLLYTINCINKSSKG